MKKQAHIILYASGIIFLIAACAGRGERPGLAMVSETRITENHSADTVKITKQNEEYKVTFIELGSVRCIPCQMMQPVMKSVEEKYGDQVKVVFYDVWTPEQSHYSEKYKIRAIPTQVFLDADGKEFFRHEGFFPEDELVKVLHLKGVK